VLQARTVTSPLYSSGETVSIVLAQRTLGSQWAIFLIRGQFPACGFAVLGFLMSGIQGLANGKPRT